MPRQGDAVKFIGQDDKETIFSRFRSHVSSGKADFFKSVGIDFVFGRREGPFVWDATSGKRLINWHCNGGVFNLGHPPPAHHLRPEGKPGGA
jgi:acetylornithine/succinyldiaminopimelate/putrescine aminotransferase